MNVKLTKYERTRILGVRAEQIKNGALVIIDYGNEKDPLKIARIEFDQKQTPLFIRRYKPNKQFIDIKVSDLVRTREINNLKS